MLMPKESNITSYEAFAGRDMRVLCGAYIFFGEEDYLKTYAVNKIKSAVMQAEGFEIFNFFDISFQDFQAGMSKLSDALFASPMMQDKTFVLVRDISASDLKGNALEAFYETVGRASKETVLVVSFRSSELEADYQFERSALYKKLSQKTEFIRFETLSRGKAAAWAKKRVSAAKLLLTDEASEVLTDMCAGRLLVIEGETDKLIAYKNYVRGENGKIDIEDVKKICSQSAADEAPFALTDAAGKWNLTAVLSVLSDCRDRREEPITVIARLSKLYSEMLWLKTARDAGLTIQAAAKKMGMNEWRAGIVYRSVEKVPVSIIEKAILKTYEADVRLKSTQTDKWVVLEKLAADIYTPKSLR